MPYLVYLFLIIYQYLTVARVILKLIIGMCFSHDCTLELSYEFY
jgi:hypothetical protein